MASFRTLYALTYDILTQISTSGFIRVVEYSTRYSIEYSSSKLLDSGSPSCNVFGTIKELLRFMLSWPMVVECRIRVRACIMLLYCHMSSFPVQLDLAIQYFRLGAVNTGSGIKHDSRRGRNNKVSP